jgi:DNA-binding transcriptional MerR regulator
MTDAASSLPGSRRAEKSAAAFRTISEVAAELDLPQHVLRFWETKFTTIKPLKRGGGRRYYRPEDVVLLKRIRELLYAKGYTIKGAQKLLREQRGTQAVQPDETTAAEPTPAASVAGPDSAQKLRAEMKSLLGELEDIRAALGGA